MATEKSIAILGGLESSILTKTLQKENMFFKIFFLEGLQTMQYQVWQGIVQVKRQMK